MDDLGIKLEYKARKTEGYLRLFNCEKFIGKSNVALILEIIFFMEIICLKK